MRPTDAATAGELGADAIGMIFVPGARRFVSVETAKAISRQVGPFVTRVGVFQDATTKTIVETAAAVSLDLVQLHGHERAEQVAELGACGLRVLKAIRVDDRIEQEVHYWRGQDEDVQQSLLGFVLETAGPSGGSGIANDFEAISRHRQAGLFDGTRLILAGGLRPENAAGAIRLVRPWAIDVSSGVEETFGQKSKRLIDELMQVVWAVD